MKILALALMMALSSFAFAPAIAAERQINITAKNFAFVPGTITLKRNQRVKLRFVGQGMHGIVIPEIGVNNVVNIGPTPTEVEVIPKKLGTFAGHCAVFCGVGHANMVLTVRVVK